MELFYVFNNCKHFIDDTILYLCFYYYSNLPLKRKARVWTDENFACILRHCKHHVPGSNPYLNCLSENCRRGMMPVVRDLGYSPYGETPIHDNSQIGNDDMDVDSTYNQVYNDDVQNANQVMDFIGQCYRKYCQGGLDFEAAITCVVDNCNTLNDMNNDDLLDNDNSQFQLSSWLKQIPISSRKHQNTKRGRPSTNYDAIQSPDLNRFIGNSHARLGQFNPRTNDFAGGSNYQTIQKRRVNDEVSQCIQSYCGSDGPVDRVFCIVKHCHRSRSVYR